MTAPPGPSLPLVRRRDGSPRIVLTLRTWLLGSHLLVFALPVLVLVGSGALARDLRDQTRWDLEHQGALLALLAEELVLREREREPAAGLAAVGEPLSTRLRQAKQATLSGIEVVDGSGRVVATSGSLLGEDRSAQVEVRRALAGEPTAVERPREPTPAPLSSPSRRAGVRVFVAVPVRVRGEVVGAMVLSRTPREELQALYQMAPGPLVLGSGAALAVVLTGGLAMGVLLTRSLRLVAAQTTRIAEGRFDELGALDVPMASHVADVALLAGAVRATADRLRRRLAYITEFAGHVSHEFKTPLATLRGTVELLADDEAMPAEQRLRFLRNAEAEVGRLQALVEGLLGLARAEEGAERAPVPLEAVLASVAARFPEVELSGAAGRVSGDRAQLEALAENLVANAFRHGAAPVEVRAWRGGGRTGFDVVDHGAGISSANQARVFDRFFTTGRDAGGTGLGLALARAVAEAHGGRIELASEPGRTCFHVDLPDLDPGGV